MSMSLKQARLIDPVLSKHAQGYGNAEFVGMALFPTVPVIASGGQILEFGREAFERYTARRAPGSAVKRVPMGYFGRPFPLVCEALDAEVPRELARDAQEVADVDLSMRAVNVVMRALRWAWKMDQAGIARYAANYPAANKVTLSGTTQWSDTTNSDPLGDIDTGMEAIRRATGMYSNVMVIPSAVYRVARSHPSARDAFGGTTAGFARGGSTGARLRYPARRGGGRGVGLDGGTNRRRGTR